VATGWGRLAALDDDAGPVWEPFQPVLKNEEPWPLLLAVENLDYHEPPFGRARVERADGVLKEKSSIFRCDNGGEGEGGEGLAHVGIRHHVRGFPDECFKSSIRSHCKPSLGTNRDKAQRCDPVVEPLK